MAGRRTPEDNEKKKGEGKSSKAEPSILYWIVSFSIIIVLVVALVYA